MQNSFGEILFELPPNLQRMYELKNFLPPTNLNLLCLLFAPNGATSSMC